MQSTIPTPEERTLAKEGSRLLSVHLQTKATHQNIQVLDEQGQAHTVVLPVSVMRLLLEVLTEVSEGNAVNIIPVHAELSTQEAADALNVSRPFLVKLLETGKIPFHKVGTHRRVKFSDVIAYKQSIDEERKAALNELAALAQENKMGY